MRKIIVAILLSMWTTVVLPATICAQELKYEVKIGLLYHDIATVWGNTKVEGGYDVNAEIIGHVLGNISAHVGFSLNLCGETSRIYFGVTPVFNYHGVVFSGGIGCAIVGNYVRKLGSPVLFRVAGEIGYQFGPHSISIILDHISNANLAEHNAGLDLLGIRYGWRW